MIAVAISAWWVARKVARRHYSSSVGPRRSMYSYPIISTESRNIKIVMESSVIDFEGSPVCILSPIISSELPRPPPSPQSIASFNLPSSLSSTPWTYKSKSPATYASKRSLANLSPHSLADLGFFEVDRTSPSPQTPTTNASSSGVVYHEGSFSFSPIPSPPYSPTPSPTAATTEPPSPFHNPTPTPNRIFRVAASWWTCIRDLCVTPRPAMYVAPDSDVTPDLKSLAANNGGLPANNFCAPKPISNAGFMHCNIPRINAVQPVGLPYVASGAKNGGLAPGWLAAALYGPLGAAEVPAGRPASDPLYADPVAAALLGADLLEDMERSESEAVSVSAMSDGNPPTSVMKRHMELGIMERNGWIAEDIDTPAPVANLLSRFDDVW